MSSAAAAPRPHWSQTTTVSYSTSGMHPRQPRRGLIEASSTAVSTLRSLCAIPRHAAPRPH